MIEFYRSLEAIEKLIILAIIVIGMFLVFAIGADGELYQECIDSGLHDKFECRSLIYGD